MAAAKLSSWLLSRGLTNSSGHPNHRQGKPRPTLLFPSHGTFLSPSCKMRSNNRQLRTERQQVKKAAQEQPPSLPPDFRPTSSGDGEENLEPGTSVDEGHPSSSDATASGSDGSPPAREVVIASDDDGDTGDDGEESRLVSVESVDQSQSLVVEHLSHLPDDSNGLAVPGSPNSLVVSLDGEHRIPGVQLEDLVGMVRNAEKNILLLNQARIHALEHLDTIFSEKESLQREINSLQMRLAENDARMKVAAQEKIHVELLEEQLEKLRDEVKQRSSWETSRLDVDHRGSPSNKERLQLPNSTIQPVMEELNSLRTENALLKNDIESLKAELSNVKSTDERVILLEKERLSLEFSLKDLESRLSASQADVTELSTLKVEYNNLWKKVENLQSLLDKTTEQADQAIHVLQQNQDLRKKVDKLEELLEEASVYKLSAERSQQYNELMQEKIKRLEERLLKSDEEIHSYVQLYQESVHEFQATLDKLKEESKKRALEGPVEDKPFEFWSRLLLMIDGWLLEKKISAIDAKLLREMVQKRDRRIHDAYMSCREKKEHESLGSFLKLASSSGSPGLHIIHIAAEMAPVAKVGGLGDVVAGLGKALQKRGHLVEVILPKYDCMQYDRVNDLRALDTMVESYFDGKLYKNKIWIGTVEGLPVYFIEPLHPSKFFWRGQFYGENDDFKRFSYFSRAALELILQAGKKPDIIHCHDWQTAFVAPLYWDIYAPKGLNSARISFTCHNFEYQGTAHASELASCGLDVHQLNRPDRMQDNAAHDRINVVKGAVVFSNIVTTVSPTYAQEVRTAEGGKGLHSTLNFHSKKFIGILNGIDADAWNPATDPFVRVQYSANDIHGKAENKTYLRRDLGLSTADSKRPLVGCITRLVPQKGVHLIRHAIYRTLELGGQFVLLGSSPVPHIQREFEGIANQLQNHENARLILKYDEHLSHSIYAASDMFIIPSIFEPCGLTQMIAMRYGSIPIARKTGGLNDSVFDIDDDTIPLKFRNGFTFLTPDERGLNGALERAFAYYKNQPDGWQELVTKDMSIDFSWEVSASQYEELYVKSVARARAASQRT